MTTSNTDEKLITKKDLLHSACNIGALGIFLELSSPNAFGILFNDQPNVKKDLCR